MPKVTTKGDTRKKEMVNPFARPIAVAVAIPAATPRIMAVEGSEKDTATREVTTLVSATEEPTERSKPAQMMVSIWPAVTIAR